MRPVCGRAKAIQRGQSSRHEIKLIDLALAFALSAMLTVSAFAQEKNSQAFSPAEITERTLHRRAVEAVIWGMPAVNAELMFQAMPAAKADFRPGCLLVASHQLEGPNAHAQS